MEAKVFVDYKLFIYLLIFAIEAKRLNRRKNPYNPFPDKVKDLNKSFRISHHKSRKKQYNINNKGNKHL